MTRFRITCILVLLGVISSEAQTTSFDGTKIFTETHGSGDTTLLFIHGWNLDHSFWQHQADYFSDRYQVVTLDLPGYGRSGKDRQEWTMEAYGKDIQAVISENKLKNVILVAHSMGGNIALEAIEEGNGDIIALIGVDNFKDVGSLPDSITLVQMDQFYEFLEADYPVNVKSASESFMFSGESPAEPKRIILDTYAAADPEIAISLIKAAFSESANETRQVQALDIPFLLISADFVPVNEESLRAHYSGPFFKNYLVENSGHFPMYERPEAFNQALDRALADLAAISDR